jgi:hypothetical protein
MGLFHRSSLFHRRGGGLFGGRSDYVDDAVVGRGGGLFLTAPSFLLFIASVVLAGAALLVRYTSVDLPIVEPSNAFAVLAIGYVILLVGVLLPRA